MHSEKQTTYAHLEPKGNAVKDQHRNENQPTPRLFHKTTSKYKAPSASAVLKVNFSFCLSQKSLRLKVYSLGTGAREGTHINPNKE
jgi:hypothetical protein